MSENELIYRSIREALANHDITIDEARSIVEEAIESYKQDLEWDSEIIATQHPTP